MNEIIENFKDVVTNKYTKFDGRAGRKEYWYYAIVNIAIGAIFSILFKIFGSSVMTTILLVINLLISLALILPGLGVTVRRLHDVGKGGGWIFIALVPIVGPFILLYFLIIQGELNVNRFGPPVE